jgi:hypothetical protein
MDSDRKHWNEQLKALQQALTGPVGHARAVELFLELHACVHACEMAPWHLPTFEDSVWEGLDDAAAQSIPPKEEHSIAWMFWHITRIEDMTMNLLVAGSPQVINGEPWLDRMRVTVTDTGSAQDPAAVAAFSAALDVPALRAYRLAVGRRTREIVCAAPPGCFSQKVDPARLQRILDEGGVVEEARWLTDYWGGRTLGGLLTMPATRHPLVHINEAMQVKKKLMRGR